MKSLWFFDEIDMFGILCPHKFKAYKECHQFNKYPKNNYIYFEEDKGDSIYLIESGKVKIGYYTEDGREVVKAILTKGEIFGEKAILGEDTRTDFAMAVANTTVCPVTVDVLQELMKENKMLSTKVYKFIGFRFKKLERRLQILLFKDTRTRLIEFLEELYEDYGFCCKITGKKIIRHPYTQKDIASLIGASRPTLNQLMNELKEENYLSFQRNEIWLLK
ncbi:Crp/Fnr family transcriptional regulator [Neptunitalea lumnitzerae]|uniref:CRP-like cAMP-activated global transcriptional regulator n=1 Tax=Neptunitalea lumnitzerae TaxID=2965509 RepID=A0ABQ5MGB8_9FLAO|nr:Crp/Fnr family transcriptional regulator [Neptunitalea sp. Y10]GLB48080.1 CRP-like cAMP-activated global transcriptional regulator [Neptunitalea sp. Y10]